MINIPIGTSNVELVGLLELSSVGLLELSSVGLLPIGLVLKTLLFRSIVVRNLLQHYTSNAQTCKKRTKGVSK